MRNMFLATEPKGIISNDQAGLGEDGTSGCLPPKPDNMSLDP